MSIRRRLLSGGSKRPVSRNIIIELLWPSWELEAQAESVKAEGDRVDLLVALVSLRGSEAVVAVVLGEDPDSKVRFTAIDRASCRCCFVALVITQHCPGNIKFSCHPGSRQASFQANFWSLCMTSV